MNNLSDGVNDGFALFYIKDGKLVSVGMNQEQADSLDLLLKVAFGDKPVKLIPADGIQKYL